MLLAVCLSLFRHDTCRLEGVYVSKGRDERAGRGSVARVGRGHRGELKEVCRTVFGASA